MKNYKCIFAERYDISEESEEYRNKCDFDNRIVNEPYKNFYEKINSSDTECKYCREFIDNEEGNIK